MKYYLNKVLFVIVSMVTLNACASLPATKPAQDEKSNQEIIEKLLKLYKESQPKRDTERGRDVARAELDMLEDLIKKLQTYKDTLESAYFAMFTSFGSD